jgi:hypothetical protein
MSEAENELLTFTESKELLLSVVAMAGIVVGGWMLYNSVMETVGAAVLALSFLCMAIVLVIA